jgi:uncharacterized protein
VIILDTGPLVAMANRRDQDHERCAELLSTVPVPLLLPEPLLSEIGYMLATRAGAQVEADFLRDVADGLYVLKSLTSADLRRVAELVETYDNLPLGTADACVIALAERENVVSIATLNHRDFGVVRPAHVPVFTLLP